MVLGQHRTAGFAELWPRSRRCSRLFPYTAPCTRPSNEVGSTATPQRMIVAQSPRLQTSNGQ